MHPSLVLGVAAGLLSATPALAVTALAPAGAIAPGTQVVDVAGKAVGTVQSVIGDQLIVKTDRHRVRLPVAGSAATEATRTRSSSERATGLAGASVR